MPGEVTYGVPTGVRDLRLGDVILAGFGSEYRVVGIAFAGAAGAVGEPEGGEVAVSLAKVDGDAGPVFPPAVTGRFGDLTFRVKATEEGARAARRRVEAFGFWTGPSEEAGHGGGAAS